MAYSYTQYTVASSNDTTTTYATPPYRSGKAATDISVAVDGVTKTAGVDYTVSGTSLTFTTLGAPFANAVVRIARYTSQNVAPSDYSENTILTSAQLNATQEQLFFMAQEALDTSSETNLAGLTFYSSSNSAPTSPTLGDLWYDTFNKYLKIYNGTEWELATPNNESFTYTSFTAESGTYSYVTVANLNTEALVFLNGVKQVKDTVKANLLASSGAKDYFIDTVNSRVYFKTLGADSVVEVILAASNLGTANSTKIETFTATAGQTVFNLSNSYLQNTNSVNIFVNGVRQSAFTETDNNTVTLTNGASVGDEVVVIINLYDTVQGTVDSPNIIHTPAGTGAVVTTLKAKLDESRSVKDFGAVGDGATNDAPAFQAALNSMTNGGVLNIPEGTYLLQAKLTTTNHVSIVGEGAKSTELVFDSTDGILIDRSSTGDRDDQVVVKELSILCKTLGTKVGLELKMPESAAPKSPKVIISNVNFHGFNTTLINTNFYEWGVGIKLNPADCAVIRDVFIYGKEQCSSHNYDTATIGIEVLGSTTVLVHKTHVMRLATGVRLSGQSEGFNFVDSVAVANNIGIHCDDTTNPANNHSIRGSHFASEQYCILIEGNASGNTPSGYHNISNCFFLQRITEGSRANNNTITGSNGMTGWVAIKAEMQNSTIDNVSMLCNISTAQRPITDGNRGIEIVGGASSTGNIISNVVGHRVGITVKTSTAESNYISGVYCRTDDVAGVEYQAVAPHATDILNHCTDAESTNNKAIKHNFETQGGEVLSLINGSASTVNSLEIYGSDSTDNRVTLRTKDTSGSNAVQDLMFFPAGGGKVSFGTHATTADVAITGYIQIKDSSGNVRKLAVIT